ncbi:MAG TPA: hypothetical protein PLS49_01875 [Candidatus Woesebacteria bacterium]|nr:hypothetical protein [Candidatus Woesebacteria bacterium]
MPKFKPSRPSPKTSLIDTESIKEKLLEDNISFSYKYLNWKTDKFVVTHKNNTYFVKVFERFRDLCRYPCHQLKTVTVKTLRNHTVDWSDVTETSFGIPRESEIVDKPFQFGVSANEHGRVIGFFIGNTFFVVWFDPDHELYS